MNKRVVTFIPATLDPMTGVSKNSNRKKRVAGYARVSTDSEEQKTSYRAQVDYYLNYINSKEDWEFVKVYADEGISGTNMKKRAAFNQMIEDALNGKIDMIVTKSISRFARNTVDTLITVRKLKEYGVEVYFEKENIYTLDSHGEMIITIMSSMAQEESRSISENIRWGHRKRFADGKLILPYKHFLGYDKGEDGLPVVNKEEAKIVNRIFNLFLQGKTPAAIAKELTEEGIPSPTGKDKWFASTITSMLQNEKYRGSAVLQKEFTVDFLTKKRKKNEGEVPQYYIEHSHEPIIEPELFDAVQEELKRRKEIGSTYSGKSIFSSRIVCGDCGGYFGSKVWHSNSKYKRTIWQCNHKFKSSERCTTPHLDEETIRTAFVRAFNKLINDRGSLIEDCLIMLNALTDNTEITEKIDELEEELQVVVELMKRAIRENADIEQDQEEYQKKYEKLEKRYEKAKAKLENLENEKQHRNKQAEDIGGFIFALQENDEPIESFSESLWVRFVDKVIVENTGDFKFQFKGGTEVCV